MNYKVVHANNTNKELNTKIPKSILKSTPILIIKSTPILIINFDEKKSKYGLTHTPIQTYLDEYNIEEIKKYAIIVVCTQNSLSGTSDHFQHHFKNLLPVEFEMLSKVDATRQTNRRSLFGMKRHNVRTRVYYNNEKVKLNFNKDKFKNSYNTTKKNSKKSWDNKRTSIYNSTKINENKINIESYSIYRISTQKNNNPVYGEGSIDITFKFGINKRINSKNQDITIRNYNGTLLNNNSNIHYICNSNDIIVKDKKNIVHLMNLNKVNVTEVDKVVKVDEVDKVDKVDKVVKVTEVDEVTTYLKYNSPNSLNSSNDMKLFGRGPFISSLDKATTIFNLLLNPQEKKVFNSKLLNTVPESFDNINPDNNKLIELIKTLDNISKKNLSKNLKNKNLSEISENKKLVWYNKNIDYLKKYINNILNNNIKKILSTIKELEDSQTISSENKSLQKELYDKLKLKINDDINNKIKNNTILKKHNSVRNTIYILNFMKDKEYDTIIKKILEDESVRKSFLKKKDFIQELYPTNPKGIKLVYENIYDINYFYFKYIYSAYKPMKVHTFPLIQEIVLLNQIKNNNKQENNNIYKQINKDKIRERIILTIKNKINDLNNTNNINDIKDIENSVIYYNFLLKNKIDNDFKNNNNNNIVNKKKPLQESNYNNLIEIDINQKSNIIQNIIQKYNNLHIVQVGLNLNQITSNIIKLKKNNSGFFKKNPETIEIIKRIVDKNKINFKKNKNKSIELLYKELKNKIYHPQNYLKNIDKFLDTLQYLENDNHIDIIKNIVCDENMIQLTKFFDIKMRDIKIMKLFDENYNIIYKLYYYLNNYCMNSQKINNGYDTISIIYKICLIDMIQDKKLNKNVFSTNFLNSKSEQSNNVVKIYDYLDIQINTLNKNDEYYNFYNFCLIKIQKITKISNNFMKELQDRQNNGEVGFQSRVLNRNNSNTYWESYLNPESKNENYENLNNIEQKNENNESLNNLPQFLNKNNYKSDNQKANLILTTLVKSANRNSKTTYNMLLDKHLDSVYDQIKGINSFPYNENNPINKKILNNKVRSKNLYGNKIQNFRELYLWCIKNKDILLKLMNNKMKK